MALARPRWPRRTPRCSPELPGSLSAAPTRWVSSCPLLHEGAWRGARARSPGLEGATWPPGSQDGKRSCLAPFDSHAPSRRVAPSCREGFFLALESGCLRTCPSDRRALQLACRTRGLVGARPRRGPALRAGQGSGVQTARASWAVGGGGLSVSGNPQGRLAAFLTAEPCGRPRPSRFSSPRCDYCGEVRPGRT